MDYHINRILNYAKMSNNEYDIKKKHYIVILKIQEFMKFI